MFPLDVAAHGVGPGGYAFLLWLNCAGAVLLQPLLGPWLRGKDSARILAGSALLFGLATGSRRWRETFRSTRWALRSGRWARCSASRPPRRSPPTSRRPRCAAGARASSSPPGGRPSRSRRSFPARWRRGPGHGRCGSPAWRPGRWRLTTHAGEALADGAGRGPRRDGHAL